MDSPTDIMYDYEKSATELYILVQQLLICRYYFAFEKYNVKYRFYDWYEKLSA